MIEFAPQREWWVVKRYGHRYLIGWQSGPPIDCAAWSSEQRQAVRFPSRDAAHYQAKAWNGRVVKLVATPKEDDAKR